MNYRLILSDVDSTLIENEVIDLLAQLAGVGERVSEITNLAMNGELDFESALRARVALLAGLPSQSISHVANELTFSPGARELIDYCRSKGIFIGAISGGFIEVLSAFQLDKEVDFIRANSLEIKEGKLTGEVTGAIIDRKAKARALRDFAELYSVPLSETVAIGDGANDLDMIEAAGLGIAFRGKPALRQRADLNLEIGLDEVIAYL
jgi:phosphoserine phosphatase